MKIVQPSFFVRVIASLPVVCFTSLALGAPGGHGAHVHGAAEMTVALEGRQLEIEFSSPAASIVGFEYRAVSDAEAEAVTKAEATLRAGAELFRFEGTQCVLEQAEVDVSAVAADGSRDAHDEHHDEHHDDAHEDEHHGHHEQKKDAHHDHHDEQEDAHHGHHEELEEAHHGHHDEHEEEHHGEHDDEVHSDITARYVFRCAEAGRLNVIGLATDGLPFALDKINVMWVTDQSQGATVLTATQLAVPLN